MSEQEHPEVPVREEELPEEPERNNLQEQLRAQRQEALEDNTHDFPIPGYSNPILLARYRIIEGKESSRIMDKVRRQTKKEYDRNLWMTMDTIIAACEGLYIRDPDADEDEEPRPLDPDGNGTARYDERLAAFLGFEAHSAREALLGVFANNETALMMHGARLSRWMGGIEMSADEEFLLGEG